TPGTPVLPIRSWSRSGTSSSKVMGVVLFFSDMGDIDDALEFLAVRSQEGVHVGDAGHDRSAGPLVFLLECAVVHDLVQGGAQFGDDGLRQPGRAKQREPQADVHVLEYGVLG